MKGFGGAYAIQDCTEGTEHRLSERRALTRLPLSKPLSKIAAFSHQKTVHGLP
jgi:hypothetical protein